MTRKYFILSIFAFVIAFQSAFCAEKPGDFTQVAKKAIPAVVSVKTETDHGRPQMYPNQEMESNDPYEMFQQDDFFGRIFRLPARPKQPQRQIGQGSGFIISNDGYILTNNHIVKDSDRILVTLANGKEYVASVVGQDPSSDLAVIKIEEKNLPSLTLGNSDTLEVGQWVTAIGNPMGLQATLTVGVISATGRSNLGLTQFENFIQTDAAINLGNSGGPLLNLNGEVVGINTAIAAHTAGFQGIGFAIPSTMASQIMEQLISDGSVTRSYLGILLQEIDNNIAEAFNLEQVQGALVADIVKDSPAEASDIKPGDIILKMNGKVVKNIGAFRNMVALMKPGTKVNLAIKRNGKMVDATLTVAPHPENITLSGASTSRFGIHVEGNGDEGVTVSKVDPGSIASWAGIRKGSIILSVNSDAVKSPGDFQKALQNAPQGKPVVFRIKQDGMTRFISLREM